MRQRTTHEAFQTAFLDFLGLAEEIADPHPIPVAGGLFLRFVV
jgi:hypothetical protein